MKKRSMILSLVLTLCMILSIGAFASGEPSGEASGEASADAKTAEEAYIEYAREFLQNELLVNPYMTQEQIDNEFMPLVEAHDYETFPAYNMYHDGWFFTGTAMTFEEFAAQYVAGEASGNASGGPSDMTPPGGIIKESPPDVEALVPTIGNINVDGSTEPSEYATTTLTVMIPASSPSATTSWTENSRTTPTGPRTILSTSP